MLLKSIQVFSHLEPMIHVFCSMTFPSPQIFEVSGYLTSALQTDFSLSQLTDWVLKLSPLTIGAKMPMDLE